MLEKLKSYLIESVAFRITFELYYPESNLNHICTHSITIIVKLLNGYSFTIRTLKCKNRFSGRLKWMLMQNVG